MNVFTKSLVKGTGGAPRSSANEGKYRDVDITDIICPSCGRNTGLSMSSIAAHDKLGSERTICFMSGQPYKPKQEDTEDDILRKMFGE